MRAHGIEFGLTGPHYRRSVSLHSTLPHVVRGRG